jgi:hypothetical protein
MDISPFAVLIFPGNLFLLVACFFFGWLMSFLIRIAGRALKKEVPKRTLRIPLLVSLFCLLLLDAVLIKTAMWRQARGFDIGFTETQIAPLGNGYSLITSSEIPHSGTIKNNDKNPERFFHDIQSLQINELYIWGTTDFDQRGKEGYFILDKRSHQKFLFTPKEKGPFGVEAKKRGLSGEELLSPYDYYLREEKKVGQPRPYSLDLWFDRGK